MQGQTKKKKTPAEIYIDHLTGRKGYNLPNIPTYKDTIKVGGTIGKGEWVERDLYDWSNVPGKKVTAFTPFVKSARMLSPEANAVLNNRQEQKFLKEADASNNFFLKGAATRIRKERNKNGSR